MPSMIERTCANRRCRAKFMARTSDVKRGWGRFCSKSCKAAEQENRTGQNAAHVGLSPTEYTYGPTFSDAHLFSNEE